VTREVLVEVVVVVKSVNKVITDGVFDVDSGMLVVVIAVGVVVWLGTGSTITGGCVGAPENVGSASGWSRVSKGLYFQKRGCDCVLQASRTDVICTYCCEYISSWTQNQ